jgi:hypothetical protein
MDVSLIANPTIKEGFLSLAAKINNEKKGGVFLVIYGVSCVITLVCYGSVALSLSFVLAAASCSQVLNPVPRLDTYIVSHQVQRATL